MGWGVVEVIMSFAGENCELHSQYPPDCLASENISNNITALLLFLAARSPISRTRLYFLHLDCRRLIVLRSIPDWKHTVQAADVRMHHFAFFAVGSWRPS